MLVMSKGALSAAQAETYYEEKYSQDDYYTEKRCVVGQWFGEGAAVLGLGGEVASKNFRAVLHGLRPSTGEVIVRNANGRSERRAGWDATFNAPKSVSIQALVGADTRLAQAHRAAVTRALAELEHYALSRQKGGSEWVVTENIVAARFDHIAARPARGADDGYGPDPHLHTHVVIANMTRRPDGQWRGLDPVEIYRSQAFASAVYRSELAREVRNLGYRIDVTGADGRWELQGYSREQVMAFSRRRQDIEVEMERQGLNGAAAAQNIAHQSRLSKDGRSEDELRAEWQARARNYGIMIERVAENAQRSGSVASDSRESIADAFRFSVDHNTEREAVIDRRGLETVALQHGMGRADLACVRDESDLLERTGQLIHAGASVSSPQGAYTTPEMVALERGNLDLMRAGQGRTRPIANADEVQAWTARKGLLADQAEAAKLTLTTTDWLTAIEGRAGSTKTTTVAAIREFAEEHGYSVHGFAPTTRAVKALSEAGLPAHTVASLLENRLRDTNRRQLWIIDESSLLPTRQVNRLLRKAREAGVERIVFVGDQRQHHAIEAGRPIYQMQQSGMAVARLETIRRQRNPQLREAVGFAAAGKIADALTLLDRQRRIREIPDIGERYHAIAMEYVAAHQAGERVLVVSPANVERRQLNTAIREALRARGHVASQRVDQTILVSRDLTRSQRGQARSYEIGDVIRFTRGNKKTALEKGSYASIEAVDRDANRLVVHTADGQRIAYNPRRLSGVEVFRRDQRVFANGDRIQFRAPDRALGIANGEFASIVAIDDRRALLRLHAGSEVSAALQRLRHIDYGYASTSHSSQGATVDRVIVNVDTMRSVDLVNQKQFYVSISRARHDISIYTDDRSALQRAVSRTPEKSIALERLNLNAGRDIKMVPEPGRQTITPNYGIRR
jgi:conjugative relaxase-like TrwC/TraI family protein